MARYKNGINGPVSGKIGNVIASSWRGVDYFKSVNESKRTGERSEAQILQQCIFGLVSRWLRPIKDLIWLGYQVFRGTKTPMNAAISAVMKDAIVVENGKPAINFSQVIISRGELIVSLILKVLALIDELLHIQWHNALESPFCRPDDRANFLFYSERRAEFIIFENGAMRSDKEAKLSLPEGFSGDTLHGYMFYVNAAGDAVSTSQYMGNIVVA
ncbi:MAG TPA: DUF6266 family protein [Pedobacter sp.]|nr:DUF6266 family protein [Pedobacter sp.]